MVHGALGLRCPSSKEHTKEHKSSSKEHTKQHKSLSKEHLKEHKSSSTEHMKEHKSSSKEHTKEHKKRSNKSDGNYYVIVVVFAILVDSRHLVLFAETITFDFI